MIPPRLEEQLDRREFADSVDAILLTAPRSAAVFPVFMALLAGVILWVAWLPFDDQVRVRGEIRVAGDAVRVQAALDGQVSAVLVEEGALVEAGAPLLQLDPANAALRGDKLAADLEAAVRALELLERQRETLRARAAAERGRVTNERARQAALLRSGLVSGRVLEDLDNELAQLDARHRQEALELDARRADAEQERERLRRERAEALLQLERHTVRAPAAGVVSRLEVRTPGGTVVRDTLLAEITPREKPLELEAEVPVRDIARVRAGLTARIKLDSYPYQEWGTLTGEVIYVATDRRDAGYAVRLRVRPPADGRIRLTPGMTGGVEIRIERLRAWRYAARKLGLLRPSARGAP